MRDGPRETNGPPPAPNGSPAHAAPPSLAAPAPLRVYRAEPAEPGGAAWDTESLTHYYQQLFEFAPDCYLVTDRNGVIEQVNQAAVRLFRCRKEFLLDRPLGLLVVPEARRDFYVRFTGLSRKGDAWVDWDASVCTARSGPVNVSLSVTPVLDGQGWLIGYFWLLRDITARVQAEQGLRAEKQLVEGLVNAAQAAVLVLDPAGVIVRANPYLPALCGRPLSDLVGAEWAALLAESDQWAARKAVVELAHGGAGPNRLFTLVTHSGRRRSVSWSFKAFHGPNGEPLTLVLGHDLTDLQEAQQRALQAERLAAIGQTVTGLAHESRNALQRTRACLEMLAWRLEGRPEELGLVERVQQAQNDLVGMLEDIREFAAPIRLDVRPCNLAEVWREAWDQALETQPGRDARLREPVAAPASAWLSADRFRLGQVFRNIFENALAACDDPVCVELTCHEADLGGRPALRVAVRDNGPGLTEEQRRRIFEPFYTTKAHGTGLGMAIARRIIEAHGGTIAVGGAGPGAEFVITLPRSVR